MSVISRVLSRFEARSDPLSDWMAHRRDVRMGLVDGPVDPELALTHSAVWACVTLISDMIATFPWHAYRKTDGVRQEVPWVFVDEPSDIVDPIVWRTQILMSLLLEGNAFGMITAAKGGSPSKVEIVSNRDVTWNLRDDGTEEWRIKGDPVELWPFGPLWHVPAYVLPGQRLGLSVLSYAAATINLGTHARQYGSEWFTKGAHPTGMLKFDGPLNETEAEGAKARWMDRLEGKHEPVVLSKFWSYEPIQLATKDAQFLETIQANTADVARFFRVQPELIGASSGNSSITYANMEQRSLSINQFTLNPWTIRLEFAQNRLIPQPLYCKANTDGFLRTDARTRSQIIDRSLRNGMLSLNEGRALEDRSPVDGGDVFMWPPTGRILESDDERSTESA